MISHGAFTAVLLALFFIIAALLLIASYQASALKEIKQALAQVERMLKYAIMTRQGDRNDE